MNLSQLGYQNNGDTEGAVVSVRERLLNAAKECFLEHDYHRVSTRMIAEKAEANISMIRYYFFNKEGLYEEMIKYAFEPLFHALESEIDHGVEKNTHFLKLFYRTMSQNVGFAKLILKVLTFNQGPGKKFIQQLLEQGRSQLQTKRGIDKQGRYKVLDIKPGSRPVDFASIAFVCLALMPVLLHEVLQEECPQTLDDQFFDQLACFNSQMLEVSS